MYGETLRTIFMPQARMEQSAIMMAIHGIPFPETLRKIKNSIYGFVQNDIFTVGDNATTMHYNDIPGASSLIMDYGGTHWTQMRTDITTSGIVTIKGTAQHDLFEIGEGGLILQYKANVWRKFTT